MGVSRYLIAQCDVGTRFSTRRMDSACCLLGGKGGRTCVRMGRRRGEHGGEDGGWGGEDGGRRGEDGGRGGWRGGGVRMEG